MQLLSLIPILVLLLYLLVSIDLVYTGFYEVIDIRNCSGEEQQFAKLNFFCYGRNYKEFQPYKSL